MSMLVLQGKGKQILLSICSFLLLLLLLLLLFQELLIDGFNIFSRRAYLNGSRLLFSLLKKDDPEVQAMAAWASCRLLESAASAEGQYRL